VRKTKTLSKSCLKLPKRTPFYRGLKTSHYGSEFGQIGLLVDRPVDRLIVIFMTVGIADRPPDRPHPDLTYRSTEARTREQISLASRLLGRPGLDLESELSGSVDWPSSQGCVYILCISIDRLVDRLRGQSTARRPGQV